MWQKCVSVAIDGMIAVVRNESVQIGLNLAQVDPLPGGVARQRRSVRVYRNSFESLEKPPFV